MTVKVKSTGKIIKQVVPFKKDRDGKVLTYIDEATNTIYKAEDVVKVKLLTEQEVYDYYQERSVTAGDRAEHLAWMFIIMLCAQLIGKSHFREFYIIAAGGIGYMLLSSLQALYQSFTSWLLKWRIKNGKLYCDYPQWIGGIAWAFYWAKITFITATSIYAVYHFMRLL